MAKLNGLKKKTAANGKTKKDYPTLPDPLGDVAKSVEVLCDTKAKMDKLKALYDAHEAELKALARKFAFSRRETPGTVKAYAPNGASVSLSLQNRYYPIDTEDAEGNENIRVTALKRIMADRFDKVMDVGFTIAIDSARIPPDKAQEFIDNLIGLAGVYECEEAISAREFVKAKSSFHIDRCEQFSEDENHEINKQMPVTVMLRSKGVQ